MKILHIADIHLDMTFADQKLPSRVGKKLRQQLLGRFDQICQLAIEQDVQVITIGGDLFDSQTILPSTVEHIQRSFAGLAPRQIIITPGKTDKFLTGSVYDIWKWSDNVTIFSPDKLSHVDFDNDIRIWGTAFPVNNDDLLEEIDETKKNILLLHKPDEKVNESNSFSDLLSNFSKESYIIAGGQHDYMLGDNFVMSGSPEQLDLRADSKPRGVVILHVTDNYDVDFVKLGQWSYHKEIIDISDLVSIDRLKEHIRSLTDKPTAFYDVVIYGEAQFSIDINSLIEDSSNIIDVKLKLDIPYDLEILRKEPTIRGYLTDQILHQISNSPEEEKMLLNSLHLSLQALDGLEDIYNAIEDD